MLVVGPNLSSLTPRHPPSDTAALARPSVRQARIYLTVAAAVRAWERQHPAPSGDDAKVVAEYINSRALVAALELVRLLRAVDINTLDASAREARLLLACDADGRLERYFEVRAARALAAPLRTR